MRVLLSRKKMLQKAFSRNFPLYTPWADKNYGLPRKKILPAQEKIFLQAGSVNKPFYGELSIGHNSWQIVRIDRCSATFYPESLILPNQVTALTQMGYWCDSNGTTSRLSKIDGYRRMVVCLGAHYRAPQGELSCA